MSFSGCGGDGESSAFIMHKCIIQQGALLSPNLGPSGSFCVIPNADGMRRWSLFPFFFLCLLRSFVASYKATDGSLHQFGGGVIIILHMLKEMCTNCALALDGVDDGERRISLGIWHGYACAGCTSPQVRVDTCEVAFAFRCSHTCGYTRVDIFVCVVALHVWE